MSGNNKNRDPLVAEKRYGAAAPKKAAPARKPRKAKRAPVKRRGLIGLLTAFIGGIFRAIWRLIWGGTAIVATMTGLGVYYYASNLPPAESLIDGRARGSVTLQDRTGETFAWRGDQFGGMITTETVSPHLVNAVVASEDKRFYTHFGVSPRGVASAVRINLRAGRGPLSGNGGSTITQQVAKLLCLGVPYNPTDWDSEAAYEADCRRTTLWRKVKEAVYAMGMEAAYTKNEILTIYLNRAYLGAGSRGFEAASERYFGKSAAELRPAEAAMLSSLLPAPSSRAPTRNLEAAQQRANVVIGLMEVQERLSPELAEDARTNPATLSSAAKQDTGGYFADWVMASGPEFFTRNTTEDVNIRTTFDQDIQASAEDALEWIFENKVREGSEAEAAIVVMSADGAVRAMVGGREAPNVGDFNRAIQARRQPGSAFKPFIFAAALEMDFSPNDYVNDTDMCWSTPGSGNWCPQNYDRQFKGPVTLLQSLVESRNIPAVILSENVGRDIVRQVAEGFGIESDMADGPALALGVSESTLIEMTGAYAGILNGGSSVDPYGLVELRLQGEAEPLMGLGGGIRDRVIRERAARELTWMMNQVVERGTGARAKIPGWQIAGKTGTTQSARDAWFIGFTGDYVTGVWMGYDDNSPLAGVTGGGLPADIWRETMTRILANQQPVPLPMQEPGDGLRRSDPNFQPGVEAPAPASPASPDAPNSPNDGAILDVLNNILNNAN
ncbi:membrane peptidoglycan carboxypeptidase [Loktanella ponticola]|uniref:peptidoglycan glycosyltransferase n=1 Tax=Yoonia ponticola TaxID=1524255 RepID=A0A7W9BM51_9RHOB|nr:transglycosylase domain-containing protein [Yoonia ponticola]MBB5723006.1 membrane peptidoglycan carboxypeptidase [Yoonia ponticola]